MKRWLARLALLLALFSAPLLGAERFQDQVRTDTGAVSASATITVFDQGTVNLSSIFSDSGLLSSKANPFTSDSDGRHFFYAADGQYDVQWTGGTPAIDTTTIGDVSLGTGGAHPVTSVFGRTGAVLKVTGDYTAADVTNALRSDANNDLNAFFQDIAGISTPATPATGDIRLFAGTDKTLKYRQDDGTVVTLDGLGGVAHAILSSQHSDSTAAAVVRGDLITGQTATPKWQRLAVGAVNSVLSSDGTDPAWDTTPTIAGVTLTGLTGALIGEGSSAVTATAAASQLDYMRRKANTTSLQYEFDSPDTFPVEDFTFSQSPAQTLVASNPEVVTLTPCPLGVDGTNSDHELRIIDATDGNEQVTITGGTCTSGLSTGTVNFTPASNHTSGNWSINSATGGLQEGVFFISAGQALKISGDVNVFAATTIKKNSIAVIGNQPGSPGGARILSNTNGQNVFHIDTAAGFQRLYFANFEVNGVSATTDTAFDTLTANTLIFENLHFDKIKAFNVDQGSDIYLRNIVVAVDVDAFFGSTSDSVFLNNLIIDGWTQRTNSPYTIAGPLIHLQRITNSLISGVGYVGLAGSAPVAIRLSNNTQGNSIVNSTLVGAGTGIHLQRNTVGAVTSTPRWNRIHNFMCDGCTVIGIDLENDADFTTITQSYFTTITTGDVGIMIRAGTEQTFISDSVFQNITGGTAVQVEAGVTQFSISGGMMSGTSGTGILIPSGASNEYLILGINFDSSITAISDSALGADRYIWANTPNIPNVISHDSTWISGVQDMSAVTSFEVPNAANPTTDAFGEIAADNDAWAASRGALEHFDGTASTFVVAALASDVPTNNQIPKISMPAGTISWEDDALGGSPTWDSIADPVAAATLVFGVIAERTIFSYEGNYTTGNYHQIRQQTGNTVGGTLLDVRAADAQTIVLRAGDGTNGITISQAGALTAEGSGTITATDLAAGALDALTEIAGTLCGTNEILEDQGASWGCIATPAGGTVRWDQLTDPIAVMTMTSDAIVELMQWDFTAAYGATDIAFRLRQVTGNPVAGSILADFRAADADIVVFRAGDGTNGITVSQAGALTAEGTGAITATLGDTATAFFGAGTLEVGIGGTGAAAFTEGSVVFAGASGVYTQDNANLFWLDGSDRLGIGTVTPDFFLEIANDGAADLAVTAYANSATARLRRAEGTEGGPVATGAGTTIGAYRFEGYNGTVFSDGASLVSTAQGLWSGSNEGANMLFFTTPTGTTTLTERMRLQHDGDLGIGTNNPDNLLHVALDTDGASILALLENSRVADAGTNETAELRYGFGTNNDVARIVAGKVADYQSAANEDSFLAIWTDRNGIATERLRITEEGDLILEGGGVDDANDLTITVATLTGGRTFTFPDAASNPVQPLTCSGTDKVSAIAATGGITCTADVSGGSPTWDSVADPVAAADLIFDSVTETSIFSYQGNYTTGTYHQIRQQTGNTSGGTLLDIRAADAQTTVLRAGDGTNGITLSQAGALTAEGTGAITATLGDSATSFFSAGNLELARLPFGAANQLLKTNTGATAQEHASLAAEAGNEISVTFGAGTITLDVTEANLDLAAIGGTLGTSQAAADFRLESEENAGTDPTADLEEETHASEHTAGGADIVTVDGVDAGAATTRSNENKIQVASHDTDCTALTDGVRGELCIEEDSENLYSCQPTAGGCDTPGEWILTGGSGTINTGTDNQVACYSGAGTTLGDCDSTFTDDGTNVVLQPGTDSTTGVQFKDADGGTPILNIDTENERLCFLCDNPSVAFQLDSNIIHVNHAYAEFAMGSNRTSNRLHMENDINVGLVGARNVWIGIDSDNTGTDASFGIVINDNFLGGLETPIFEITEAGDVEITGTLALADSANVASATTTTLTAGNLHHITGTTTITTLDDCGAAENGRLETLIFDAVLTFTDGNNLKLAGNFVTTADDVIQLICDGSNWYETSRSVN